MEPHRPHSDEPLTPPRIEFATLENGRSYNIPHGFTQIDARDGRTLIAYDLSGVFDREEILEAGKAEKIRRHLEARKNRQRNNSTCNRKGDG